MRKLIHPNNHAKKLRTGPLPAPMLPSFSNDAPIPAEQAGSHKRNHFSTKRAPSPVEQLPLFLAIQFSNYLLDNDLFLFAALIVVSRARGKKATHLVARLQPNFSSLHPPLPCPYYAGSIFKFIH